MHTNNIISGTPQAHIPQARQAQRRRGGHPRGHTHLFVLDGATLIRPTGSSRKVLYPRPGSVAPPGRAPPAPYPPLCWMAASPYPAYGGSRKPLYRRPGKRSAAGQDTADTVPVFVPDGATLIRPTGSSRKLLYRRPGKRSAAGR
ncbi:hypothetical protein IE985_11435 [Klebsiella pneumoniae]|nr:hypothetical protein [Klebsiella pneumoniae]